MKAGDKIYLAVNDRISFCEVVGFHNNCTHLKIGNRHASAARYNRGLFYGFGYIGLTDQTRYLFLTKIWHYYPAVLCERIRIILPEKWAKRLKLYR